jgi:death on curing protein
VSFLTYAEVLAIHERVCNDFANTDDPVGLGGVRDQGRLLESVIARQHVGYGDDLKYADPLANAATLTFGLCCGHPFNNGNKRTALVSMLAHLDRNDRTVVGIKQKELYTMIKSVANHSLGDRPDRRRRDRPYSRREADTEVELIRVWLSKNARKVQRGERTINYRQLRRILSHFDLEMANPKNNSIGIYRAVEKRRGLMRNKVVMERQHIATIGYPGDSKIVGMNAIKQVRRLCQLDEKHGCDTAAFYDGADIIDVFINEYRTILEKLARE